MEYTPSNYEQDKRIAQHIYRKHFKGHFLKDDLIQVAIYELWRLRKQANSVDYIANACDTARKKMISLLRKETRHLTDSLDRFVGDDYGLRLSDVIATEQPTTDEYCEYAELLRKILPPNMTARTRQVISLHLKHYTQREIACRVGLSQPYVNRIIRNFRHVAKQILEQ